MSTLRELNQILKEVYGPYIHELMWAPMYVFYCPKTNKLHVLGSWLLVNNNWEFIGLL